MARRIETLRSQRGMTLVEVSVAILILLIGVLGTVTMIDGANAITSRTKAREGGTALARSVLEIARGIPYKELTSERLLDELEGRSGFADFKPGVAGHQISSRGFVYTVAPTVCAMDEPVDDLGTHDPLAVDYCAESSVLAQSAPPLDRNPDDYRRIEVGLSWADNATHVDSTRQTGLVSNPVGGIGPSVTALNPLVPSTTTITSAATENPSYSVTTSALAAEVSWSVDGARLGQATGSGTAWTLTWPIGPASTPAFVDCTYVLQAEGYDADGLAGTPRALTVKLNRRAAFAPPNFAGGRNLNGDRVDLQWDTNQECDVEGYRVYRGTSSGSVNTLVCEVSKDAPKECVDETAPAEQAGTTLYYQVLALDKDAAGVIREGTRTAALAIDESNDEVPTVPSGFTVCTGGNPGCDDIDGEPAPSGTAVLAWEPSEDPDEIAFYRVYRDGSTYADRLDVLFPVAGKPLVFIDNVSGGPHAYRVSAVDSLFGESALSAEVVWQ